MDMKLFLSKMGNQVGFHRKDQTAVNKIIEEDTDAPDVMYDDFVVLNDDPDDSFPVDRLPSYSKALGKQYDKEIMRSSSRLPSYDSLSLKGQQSKVPPSYHQSANMFDVSITHSTFPNVSHSIVSPVSDIPFQCHPNLTAKQRVQLIFQGLDLEVKQFNKSKYSHSFENEYQCLGDCS